MNGVSIESGRDLDGEVSLRVFGGMVGISGPAVHKLLTRGVLERGGTAKEWIRSYCENLRIQGQGHGGDEQNTLTRQRIEESKQKTMSLALANERELSQLVIADDLAAAIDKLAASMSENIIGSSQDVVDGIKLNQLPTFDEELVHQPLREAARRVEVVGRKISEQIRPSPRFL